RRRTETSSSSRTLLEVDLSILSYRRGQNVSIRLAARRTQGLTLAGLGRLPADSWSSCASKQRRRHVVMLITPAAEGLHFSEHMAQQLVRAKLAAFLEHALQALQTKSALVDVHRLRDSIAAEEDRVANLQFQRLRVVR